MCVCVCIYIYIYIYIDIVLIYWFYAFAWLIKVPSLNFCTGRPQPLPGGVWLWSLFLIMRCTALESCFACPAALRFQSPIHQVALQQCDLLSLALAHPKPKKPLPRWACWHLTGPRGLFSSQCTTAGRHLTKRCNLLRPSSFLHGLPIRVGD